MNKIIAVIIIVAACSLGVYFLFFVNKEVAEGTASTPNPIDVDDDFLHDNPPLDEPFNVVVSTDLIKEILYQFAKTRTNEPYVCIKPGVNPLTYKPTAEDEQKILAADLVLYTGLGMEPGLETLIRNIGDKVRCESLSGFLADELNVENNENPDQIILSTEYAQGYDPHFWWNPRIWEKVIKHVARILTDVDPAYGFNYKSIFQRYGQSLSLLNKRYIESWSGRLAEKRKHLVTLHPAFTYFARKYGYKTLSLYTSESPGEITPARRKLVAEYIVGNKVPSIFPEVGFPMTEIEVLQAEVKKMGYDVKIGEHLYSYFLGGEGSKDFLYLNAGRTLMDRIYSGLKSPDDPEMPSH